MRCIIFCDNYKGAYQEDTLLSRFEIIDYLKTKAIDFTFGLGSGQLLSLYLSGAYNKESTEAILRARDVLIYEQFSQGALAKLYAADETQLDLWLEGLDEADFLRKVDKLSDDNFLISGNEKTIKKLSEVGKVEVLRRGALHTILAKDLISPYAEILREHEIHPFVMPLINTRNIGIMKHAKVAQELVDSLTLPQHFFPAFLRTVLLGANEFYFIEDELGITEFLRQDFPELKILSITTLEDLKKYFDEEVSS